jgi:uncharacterized MAPEG superfamily protein
LIFAAVLVQATYAAFTCGLAFGFCNREGTQPSMGPAGLRIDRTLGNLKEGAIMYLPLALLAVGLNILNGLTRGAALLTLVSRLIYIPVLNVGIPVLRTMVWAPSFVAIPVLLVGILVGATGTLP